MVHHQGAACEPVERAGQRSLEPADGRKPCADRGGACRMPAQELEGPELVPFELSPIERALNAERDDGIGQRRHQLGGERADPVAAQELLAQRIARHFLVGEQLRLAAHPAVEPACMDAQHAGIVPPPFALVLDVGLLQGGRDDQPRRIMRRDRDHGGADAAAGVRQLLQRLRPQLRLHRRPVQQIDGLQRLDRFGHETVPLSPTIPAPILQGRAWECHYTVD